VIGPPTISHEDPELAYAIHIEVWSEAPDTYGIAAYEVECLPDEPEIPQDRPEPTGLEQAGVPESELVSVLVAAMKSERPNP
jgi:hypothetical protein